MTKLCKVCGELRPHNPDKARRSKASGFFGAKCWGCYLVHKAEGNNAASKRWYAKNATPAFLAQEVQRHLAWQTANPDLANANTAKYRADKDKRTPSWADLAKIEQVYKLAQELGLEVDHVVPLRGKKVSGLHTHNNLQLLSRSENAKKSNKWH
jgi:hypothetical protein